MVAERLFLVWPLMQVVETLADALLAEGTVQGAVLRKLFARCRPWAGRGTAQTGRKRTRPGERCPLALVCLRCVVAGYSSTSSSF